MLIVEHNRNHRLLLEEELAGEGYHTLAAANASEAIIRLAAATPDAVVLDPRLPGAHGAQLIEDLRTLHPRLPIVVHTADSAYHQRFTPSAVDACVLKNSNLSALTETVRRLLAARWPSYPSRHLDHAPPSEAARPPRGGHAATIPA